jgi:hypothetical protein
VQSTRFPICEYESLHRLEGTFDYMTLDEFRSTAATIVASTNGERIAQHWETPKEPCKIAQKALFLDADMCVDSCSYKIQDVLMKHRTEFRLRTLLDLLTLRDKGQLGQLHESNFMKLQQFVQESKQQHACACCGGEHSKNGICRIENTVHKMQKTLRLVNSDEMLLQLSKDTEADKRIAIACGSVHDAQTLQAYLRHYATGKVGLYTGKTDNSNHFIDLAAHWDPLQIIIYTSTLTTSADYCALWIASMSFRTTTPAHQETCTKCSAGYASCKTLRCGYRHLRSAARSCAQSPEKMLRHA